MPLGIAHSAFLDWDPDDRYKALAWQARESRRCNSCGTRPDEWNPARGGHRDAYVVDARTCPGCRALRRAAQEDAEEPDLGAYNVLTPNPHHADRSQ